MKHLLRAGLRASLLFILTGTFVCADEDRDNGPGGGFQASVQLRHRIFIPQIIYLRVGSAIPGTVDKVTIDIANSPSFTGGGIGNNQSHAGSGVPLGNAIPVPATANGTLSVDLRSNVGSVTLGYDLDNLNGLSNGAGRFIPYDQIETVSNNTNLLAPILSNNGSGAGGSPNVVVVTGNLFSGRVINRQANWTYSYKNEIIPVAGTYTGRITYTAAAP